jgi:hypothetical protein
VHDLLLPNIDDLERTSLIAVCHNQLAGPGGTASEADRAASDSAHRRR